MPTDCDNDECFDGPTFLEYALAVRAYIHAEWPFVSQMMQQPPAGIDTSPHGEINATISSIVWQSFLSGLPYPAAANECAQLYSNVLRSFGFSYLD
jgi:hypothetical protein